MRNDAVTRFDIPHRRPPPTSAAAFRAAHPHLRAHAGPELVAVAVDADGSVHHTTVASGGFLVIGRHSRCALRLDDPAVSLRHLVVGWSDSPEPTIRLWDLRTGGPVVTEDATPTGSVVADGVLFATVGRYVLIFAPPGLVTAEHPDTAWHALPERRFATARFASQRPSSAPGSVTHTLPPLVFGEEAPIDLPRGANGRLVLEVPEGRTERWVSGEQLDRGLLFGRYGRCELSNDRDAALSRVHLLVVRIGERVWAVDTASTNGTRHNGVPVAASLLSGQVSLLLARRCIVRWAEAAR